MNALTRTLSPLQTLGFGERRSFGRYRLPVSRLVEARWQGRLLPLEYAPLEENISAGGAILCLARGPAPPVHATLDITFPLMERPFQSAQMYAHCRGRVVRQDSPHRVAVFFEDVELVREDRPSTLPVPFVVPA
jgi:hypothetical protein